MKKVFLAPAVVMALALTVGCNSTPVTPEIEPEVIEEPSSEPTDEPVDEPADEPESSETSIPSETPDENETSVSDTEVSKVISNPEEISDVSVGSFVTFGRFEQDGDESNGQEPLEWLVLDNGNDGALLISKYVLKSTCMVDLNKENCIWSNDWETSDLRAYGNNEFYQSAFNEEEQAMIRDTSLSNIAYEGYKYEGTGIAGGNDTIDKVFILSLEEMEKYFDITSTYDNAILSPGLIAEPTAYALSDGGYLWADEITEEYFNDIGLANEGYTQDVIGKTGAWWYFRVGNKDNEDIMAYAVTGYGGAMVIPISCDGSEIGYRPAIYVMNNKVAVEDAL